AVSIARLVPVSLATATSFAAMVMTSFVAGGPPARPGPAARTVVSSFVVSSVQEPASAELPCACTCAGIQMGCASATIGPDFIMRQSPRLAGNLAQVPRRSLGPDQDLIRKLLGHRCGTVLRRSRSG